MICEEIHEIAFFADKAFEEKDEKTLRDISRDCLEWSRSDKYTLLEKGILSYHGATATSDYIELKSIRIEIYEENEKDIEFCLLLFRNCINFFEDFKKDFIETCSKQEYFYLAEYESRAITNYSILLNRIGRFIKSIHSIEELLDKNFSMAKGNHATTIINYGLYDYDDGHTDYFHHYAYKQLKSLTKDLENEQAFYFWQGILENIEKRYDKSFLLEDYDFGEIDLGGDLEELYRRWCLERKLFLNTMNDVTLHPVAAYDILHLPDIVTGINEGPKYHGLFNQIKQEYVSARYMLFEGINQNDPHFSDKEVHLVNTLDYPVYGLGIEKIKFAYRSLYSIFDRIAFLINEYFELGIEEKDVSYKSIWRNRQGRGKKSYETRIHLKANMVNLQTYNQPLLGLYWLCKDISKQKVEHHYLDPNIEMLATIRNHLEHKYLKIHDSWLFPLASDRKEKYDPIAFSISYEEFVEAAMILISYVREAIILTSLAIHQEEVRERKDAKTLPMFLDSYRDEWKY
ncbi:LA2681 family HEPN domain-containing protein [Lysinibacillus sp. FSL H8-0500]|uniref:LA2681 family HEPN domain-containing protein n=1 Tax=Lysinibacillus sp. FSL H8-0500 TaxID=2921393 RepID=UPI003100AE76